MQLKLMVGTTRVARLRIAAAHALVWLAAKLVRGISLKAVMQERK